MLSNEQMSSKHATYEFLWCIALTHARANPTTPMAHTLLKNTVTN